MAIIEKVQVIVESLFMRKGIDQARAAMGKFRTIAKQTNAPITSIYGIVHEYLNYRNDLINNKYSELFAVGDDEDEDLDGKDLAEYNKRKNEEKAFNKWAYESITYDLADGNLTEMDNILDKSLIYVLNILSMKTETKR